MFWITARSAGFCCPDNVLASVAMFSAICVSTGRSCRAMLIHCGLHPVLAIEIASARTSRDLDLEWAFEWRFIIVSGITEFRRMSAVVGRTPDHSSPTVRRLLCRVLANDGRLTTYDGFHEISLRLSPRR